MHFWIFQSGENLHLDKDNFRPMRAINLADTLIAKGHSVTLWSSDFYHQKKKHRYNKFKKKKINNKLEIILIPSPGYKKNISVYRLIDHLILSFNLKKKINIEKKIPNAVFIGYPPIETSFTLVNWCKKRKIPCILDIKDRWPEIFLDNLPTIVKKIFYIFIFPYFYMAKRTMINASAICSITDSNHRWSLNFSKRKKSKYDIKVPLTSPNYKLIQNEKNKAKLWFAKRGIVKNENYKIIFVGSFSSKNFDFECVFDAADILQENKVDCEFIFCGYGEFKNNLKKRSKKNKLIKILGTIDYTKMTVLSELSSVYIAPYKNNPDFVASIPNKIIDAFRTGMPLLCPLKGEVKNLINNNNVGVTYTSSKSLSKNIETLIKNPSLRNQLSKNAKKLYQNKFDFYKNYNRLVKNLELMSKIK